MAPSCRGGATSISPFGYVLEYAPDHPRAQANGFVPQHRLVMECILGRLLEPHEVVHHKNHLRTDNRASNLALMDRSSHQQLHAADEGRPTTLAPLTGAQVRKALEGRTTLQAAALLGVHPQTLRNRFGHLLQKRRSPGAGLPPQLAARVKALAEDPKVSTRQAAAALGVTLVTLRAWVALAGVEWASAPRGRPKSR